MRKVLPAVIQTVTAVSLVAFAITAIHTTRVAAAEPTYEPPNCTAMGVNPCEWFTICPGGGFPCFPVIGYYTIVDEGPGGDE